MCDGRETTELDDDRRCGFQNLRLELFSFSSLVFHPQTITDLNDRGRSETAGHDRHNTTDDNNNISNSNNSNLITGRIIQIRYEVK